MKFLLDMPIPPGMAGWLRERGHDAVHAAEIGLAGSEETGAGGRGTPDVVRRAGAGMESCSRRQGVRNRGAAAVDWTIRLGDNDLGLIL